MSRSDVYLDCTTHFQRQSNPMLRQCSETGDSHGVLAALARDADPLSLDEKGKNALMLAAESGHLPSVNILLKANSTAALRVCSEGKTALMLAAEAGHLECVRVLVAYSDVDAQDSEGFCALMLSLNNNEVPTSRLLLRETNLNDNSRSGGQLLQQTIEFSAPASTQFLLQEGAPLSDTPGHPQPAPLAERFLTIAPQEIHLALLAAVRSEQWACVDALAPYANPVEIAALFKRVGARLLPQWSSRLEQQVLARTLDIVPPPVQAKASFGPRQDNDTPTGPLEGLFSNSQEAKTSARPIDAISSQPSRSLRRL